MIFKSVIAQKRTSSFSCSARRQIFKVALVSFACLAKAACAVSLDVVEANGNTVEDQSEGNVIFPVIHWSNDKPVTSFVRLGGFDTSSDIVLAGILDTPHNQWRGFRIELGDGVTWSRGLRTVTLPWQIAYFSFYPFGGRHVSMRADATSVEFGFKTPIRQLHITGRKDQIDRDIAGGQAPWELAWLGVAWKIDRRSLPSGDGFRIRFVPLLKHPQPCPDDRPDHDQSVNSSIAINQYCINDMLNIH